MEPSKTDIEKNTGDKNDEPSMPTEISGIFNENKQENNTFARFLISQDHFRQIIKITSCLHEFHPESSKASYGRIKYYQSAGRGGDALTCFSKTAVYFFADSRYDNNKGT